MRGILWAFGCYSQIFHGRLDIGVLMGSGHQQQRRIVLWILFQYFLQTRASQWIKDKQINDGGNSQSPRIFQSQFYCVYCSVPAWPPSATVSRRLSSFVWNIFTSIRKWFALEWKWNSEIALLRLCAVCPVDVWNVNLLRRHNDSEPKWVLTDRRKHRNSRTIFKCEWYSLATSQIEKMYFEPSDLSKAKLPTKRDVICYLKLLKQEGSLRVSKHHKLFDYSTAVTNALCELWQRANISIVSQSTIRKKIVKTVETYYVVNKKWRRMEWIIPD